MRNSLIPKNHLPVIHSEELLGFVPDRGNQASFYDVSRPDWPKTKSTFKKFMFNPGNGTPAHPFYVATGNRQDILKTIWDIGFINQQLEAEISHLQNQMLLKAWGTHNGKVSKTLDNQADLPS